jgi:hypothetical protein
MFNKLKSMWSTSAGATPAPSLADKRREAMIDALGEPEHVDHDADTERQVDIYAFGRNFIEACDSAAEDDEGFVLVTSGMSDRLMTPSDAFDADDSLAAELVWYVRDLNPEYFGVLRWLAKLPSMDNTWFGMGHTVPMPQPPLSFCAFSTFLFLPPIIRTDRDLLEDLEQQGHAVRTLVVHLISPQEHALVRQEEGLDQFLDLLDEHDYPLVFSPSRESIVP